MKYQQVSVDLVNMMMTACSYLALAGAAWVFLRLLQACFWLPRHLRKQNSVQKLLQDKVDSYEKYLAECEAKEKIETAGEEINSKNDIENSDKWQKQRESLEFLKEELNRVKDGVNISEWDYLLEENQDIVIGSDNFSGIGNDIEEDKESKKNIESEEKEKEYKDEEGSNSTCDKKDN